MNKGNTILFKLPKAEYRTGCVIGNSQYDGVKMPIVRDYTDSEYPVHSENIKDVGNEKWTNKEHFDDE